MGWGARLLVALALVLVGAAAAVWGLGHYKPAARFLGIEPAEPQKVLLTPKPIVTNQAAVVPAQPQLQVDRARIDSAGRQALASIRPGDLVVTVWSQQTAIKATIIR